MNGKSGFTLVEIMIVVAIIGLLAAIAIPNFIQARKDSQANACHHNLDQIVGAKEQWAFAHHATSASVPVAADIVVYLSNNAMPPCPGGGTYTIGNMGTAPSCSMAATDPRHVIR